MDQMNPKTLEINKLFEDVYDGKIPKRVPICTNIDSAFCIEYAGFDLRHEQYSIEKTIEAIDITTRDFDVDTVIENYARNPVIYKLLGAKNFAMAEDGFMQHPEVRGMEVEDYDELIKDPMKTIWDKILPRLYTSLNGSRFEAIKAVTRAYFDYMYGFMQIGEQSFGIANKYGRGTYNQGYPTMLAPFDFLTGQLRSFSEINKDIRRYPEKVLMACDALLPVCTKAALNEESSKYNRPYVPSHMAPYMNEKNFEKFYWPTYKRYVENMVEAGAGVNLFLENDWMRYADNINELPQGTMLMFEYGEPAEIKDKFKDKFIISGNYPLNAIKTESKDKCVDLTKKMLDIYAPGGGYIFNLDKIIIRLKDIDITNFNAVTDTVHTYGIY